MYLPSLVVMILPYFFAGLNMDYSSTTSFRRRYASFRWYTYLLIVINVMTVMAIASFYKVLESGAGAIISILAAVLILVLPTGLNDIFTRLWLQTKSRLKEYVTSHTKIRSPKKSKRDSDSYIFKETLSDIRTYIYRQAKHKFFIINKLCDNATLYNVVLSFTVIVVGLCAVNYSRACSYIDGELTPMTEMEIITESSVYKCDNIDYLYVGESADFLFVYDKAVQRAIVIPRDNILLSYYSISENMMLFKRKLVNTTLDSSDVHTRTHLEPK